MNGFYSTYLVKISLIETFIDISEGSSSFDQQKLIIRQVKRRTSALSSHTCWVQRLLWNLQVIWLSHILFTHKELARLL